MRLFSDCIKSIRASAVSVENLNGLVSKVMYCGFVGSNAAVFSSTKRASEAVKSDKKTVFDCSSLKKTESSSRSISVCSDVIEKHSFTSTGAFSCSSADSVSISGVDLSAASISDWILRGISGFRTWLSSEKKCCRCILSKRKRYSKLSKISTIGCFIPAFCLYFFRVFQRELF